MCSSMGGHQVSELIFFYPEITLSFKVYRSRIEALHQQRKYEVPGRSCQTIVSAGEGQRQGVGDILRGAILQQHEETSAVPQQETMIYHLESRI